MDDLISRQNAINSIESHIRTGDELYPITETDKILNHAFEISASCIYNMPSAEPKQKTGKWIPVDSFSAYGGDQIMWEIRGNPVAFHYCSECREQAYANEDGDEILSEFCPCCGSRMEREEE